MNNDNIKGVIESLLFVWGEPLGINDIAQVLNLKNSEIEKIMSEMIEEYAQNDKRGLLIKQFGNTYQLATKKENYDFIQKLMQGTQKTWSLSNAALETLSIIAYKQPVTRVDIDIIRGVKSSNIIKTLLEKGLIMEAGKLDKPGKPMMYSTTPLFLKHFGLKTIEELPKVEIEEETKQ